MLALKAPQCRMATHKNHTHIHMARALRTILNNAKNTTTTTTTATAAANDVDDQNCFTINLGLASSFGNHEQARNQHQSGTASISKIRIACDIFFIRFFSPFYSLYFRHIFQFLILLKEQYTKCNEQKCHAL